MPVVQLFHTCLVNEFAPEAGLAVVRVLERLGFDVEVPRGQTCCGQPAFNAGFQDQARVAARHAIAVLDATSGPIVIPSGSCGDMVIHQFEQLFADDPYWCDRARAVAVRCREFSAFVAAHLGALRLTRPIEAAVAYHPSCHLMRGLAVDAEPKAIMAAIPGLQRRELVAEEECCGFGGLFAVKHADISARMLERKIDNILGAGAERLVTCDIGCLLHLGGGLHRRGAAIRVQHLAELVDEACS
jgi:L-lactate dehydrogenase complex protein LldE